MLVWQRYRLAVPISCGTGTRSLSVTSVSARTSTSQVNFLKPQFRVNTGTTGSKSTILQLRLSTRFVFTQERYYNSQTQEQCDWKWRFGDVDDTWQHFRQKPITEKSQKYYSWLNFGLRLFMDLSYLSIQVRRDHSHVSDVISSTKLLPYTAEM